VWFCLVFNFLLNQTDTKLTKSLKLICTTETNSIYGKEASGSKVNYEKTLDRQKNKRPTFTKIVWTKAFIQVIIYKMM
jgi:hypothetical protein